MLELAGMPALMKLQEVVEALEPGERALALDGLLAGLVIDENTPDYERGDFLVRAIQGGDRDTGALIVGERVRVGQTMRFHVRDAASADDDLRAALREARGGGRARRARRRPAVQLQRARNAHVPDGRPRRDGRSPRSSPRIPAAGLFCNGEIGPVGGRSFLHAFTATMVLFESTS